MICREAAPQMNPELELTAALRARALAAGASLVGFADVAGMARLPRAVVVAIAHSSDVFTSLDEMPSADYYREYTSLNARLGRVAEEIGDLLHDLGHDVHVNPPTLDDIDTTTLDSPFPHKTAATRAGLGWIGKSALLVTPEYGPAVRMATVLTEAPLSVGEPVGESRCGECNACGDACPGGAILGEDWHAGRPRHEFYDAFACYRTATARAAARGIDCAVCGICMAVCPWRKGGG